MRILNTRSTVMLLLVSVVAFGSQTRRFSKDDVEYRLDLPSPAWQVVSRLDVHDHLEFINGNDASDGYVRMVHRHEEALCTATELIWVSPWPWSNS